MSHSGLLDDKIKKVFQHSITLAPEYLTRMQCGYQVVCERSGTPQQGELVVHEGSYKTY